jgi:hypothetical protein
LQLQQKQLEEKNQSLTSKLREKNKKQQQLQKMYTELKQKEFATGLQNAAEDDVEQELNHHVNTLHAGIPYRNGQYLHSRAGSGGSGGSGDSGVREQRRPGANAWHPEHGNAWTGGQTSCKLWSTCQASHLLTHILQTTILSP